MFEECCIRVQDCCWNYIDCCPVAPYTGYIALSILALFFFWMWCRSSASAKAAKAVNVVLQQQMKMGAGPAYNASDVLGTISRIQSEALETISEIHRDSSARLATANEQAMQHIENIVEELNGTESDDDE